MGKKSRVGKPWTKDEEHQLVLMFDAGWPFPAICGELRRNEAGILTRLTRLGLVISTECEVYKTKHCWHRIWAQK